MKKNGFTLIELIASVTILAFIALLAFPAILNSLKKGQDQVDEGVIQVVESAAEVYANENDSYNNISVCKLAQNGYISTSFFEKNKDKIGKGRVNISSNSSKYTYTFQSTGGDATCDLG